jgi:hypothetical protein
MKDIEIEHYCDGWTVKVDGQRFHWDHNDEDMGTEGIKNLLKYLGHNVTVAQRTHERWCFYQSLIIMSL